MRVPKPRPRIPRTRICREEESAISKYDIVIERHLCGEQEEKRMPDELRVTTEDNELSLEEMSQALPDTSTIMTRVGESWWHMICPARGGNWPLRPNDNEIR